MPEKQHTSSPFILFWSALFTAALALAIFVSFLLAPLAVLALAAVIFLIWQAKDNLSNNDTEEIDSDKEENKSL